MSSDEHGVPVKSDTLTTFSQMTNVALFEFAKQFSNTPLGKTKFTYLMVLGTKSHDGIIEYLRQKGQQKQLEATQAAALNYGPSYFIGRALKKIVKAITSGNYDNIPKELLDYFMPGKL